MVAIVVLIICLTVLAYKFIDSEQVHCNYYRLNEIDKKITHLAKTIAGIEAMCRVIVKELEKD